LSQLKQDHFSLQNVAANSYISTARASYQPAGRREAAEATSRKDNFTGFGQL